jgi:nucleoid DNA-binding protein
MPKANIPRPENQRKHIQGRRHIKALELIRMTADSSKYHVHEVEDILNHLVANMQLLLTKGDLIKIGGLGTFQRRRVKPRFFKSPIYGSEHFIMTSDSVTFKPDTHLRNIMQAARENAEDSVAYLLWIKELEAEGKVPEGTWQKALKYFEEKKENKDSKNL